MLKSSRCSSHRARSSQKCRASFLEPFPPWLRFLSKGNKSQVNEAKKELLDFLEGLQWGKYSADEEATILGEHVSFLRMSGILLCLARA